MVFWVTFHSGVGVFVEKLSFSLQDPIFLVFFEFFRGLFELDLLL